MEGKHSIDNAPLTRQKMRRSS